MKMWLEVILMWARIFFVVGLTTAAVAICWLIMKTTWNLIV